MGEPDSFIFGEISEDKSEWKPGSRLILGSNLSEFYRSLRLTEITDIAVAMSNVAAARQNTYRELAFEQFDLSSAFWPKLHKKIPLAYGEKARGTGTVGKTNP